MTEENLMTEVKNGDLDKASELFELYHRRLYNYFAKITFDREISHDLTQNVFLRMLTYRESYREGNKFKPWIFQIARNVFADHYRSKKVKQSDFTDLEMICQEAASQHEDLEHAEREKTLYRSLSRLPQDQREILVMSKFQKMKYEEIASITDYTVANIKVKVHRAIKALRDAYFEIEQQTG